jgi:hypothetical protein
MCNVIYYNSRFVQFANFGSKNSAHSKFVLAAKIEFCASYGVASPMTFTRICKPAISESSNLDTSRYGTLQYKELIDRLLPVCVLIRSINAVRVITDILQSTFTIEARQL